MTIPGVSKNLPRGVEEDGFRGRDTVPPSDPQSVNSLRLARSGSGFVGHTLDDETAPLPTGRHRVEDVDGVGKRSRGGGDGNQPDGLGRRYPGQVARGASRIASRYY